MCYAEDEKLSGSILSIVLGALTTQLRNTCTNCSNCAPSRPPARPSLLIQKWDFALQPDFYPQGFQLSQTKTGKGCAWLRPGSRRQGDTSSCTRRHVFLTQVGRPGLKDVFSRACTTRCKPPLFFRVEVETNITWFRGGNIGPAPESPAPGRRKRLRWAAESRGCAPLDHGDPGEAPAGELWRQTQEHPSPPRLAASPSAAPSRTRLRGLPRVICRTPHPLPQPRPFLRARARRRLLRPQRALPGGATPLRLLISGGRACGQRGPGPGGQLPELVPAGRTGAESQGEWGAGWMEAGAAGKRARSSSDRPLSLLRWR